MWGTVRNGLDRLRDLRGSHKGSSPFLARFAIALRWLCPSQLLLDNGQGRFSTGFGPVFERK